MIGNYNPFVCLHLHRRFDILHNCYVCRDCFGYEHWGVWFDRNGKKLA